MAGEIEAAAIDLIEQAFGPVERKVRPPFLLNPGIVECGALWGCICKIYAALTGMVLPEIMPPRERRELDGSVSINGIRHLIEIDETQHFNSYRKLTFEFYPDDLSIAFNRALWIEYCEKKRKLEGGGFGKPKPPLFPGEHGRHKQRAFRDAVADILPSSAGWGATIRIAYFELGDWVFISDSTSRMRALLLARLSN